MAQRAVAGSSVPFDELVGIPKLSRRISANRKKKGEVRHGIIPWSGIDLLFAECFPAAPSIPGVHPSVPFLFVESVDIMPWPPNPSFTAGHFTYNSNLVNYAWGLATIKYAPLPYDSTTLITRKSTYSSEVQLMPASGCKWQDTGDPVKSGDTQSGKVISMIDHTFEFHRVHPSRETALDGIVRGLKGKVNDGAYAGIPDQTLLFKGASKSWTIDSSGNQTFTFGMQFKERSLKIGGNTYGWNHFFRNEDGTYAILLTKDNDTVYEKASNFSDLFTIV